MSYSYDRRLSAAPAASPVAQRNGAASIIDKRTSAATHARLKQKINASQAAGGSCSIKQLMAEDEMDGAAPAHVVADETLQAKFASTAAAQLVEKDEARANNTGLPNHLKAGIEHLSGISMDHVKVHYNSSQPAQLNAHAYAQGSDIHIGPAQEQYLPHEAWHVVQQAQGRVRPTVQMKGGTVAVNDDVGLEGEADLMGARALQMATDRRQNTRPDPVSVSPVNDNHTLEPAPNAQGIKAGRVDLASNQSLTGDVMQRAGNRAYNALISNDEEENSDLDDDSLSQSSEMDTGSPLTYLDAVGSSYDENLPPAYIVNAILSYREVDEINAVIGAIMEGLDWKSFGDRIGIVLGINAHVGNDAALDEAIEQALAATAKWQIPIGIVRSTWRGTDFPYGAMRNAVLHSEETRQISHAFIGRGYHPYISSQDFDTGARRVPGKGFSAQDKGFNLYGEHIFSALDRRLNQGSRPLMIAGGYRPGTDFIERTKKRLETEYVVRQKKAKLKDAEDAKKAAEELRKAERKKEKLAKTKAATNKDKVSSKESREPIKSKRAAKKKLTALERCQRIYENAMARLEEEPLKFEHEFTQHVQEDMAHRQALSKVHPLLPYAPEPNLFLDAMPIVFGSDLGLKRLDFGEGSAEFNQLAKGLSQIEMEELLAHYSTLHELADDDIDVPVTTPSSENISAFSDDKSSRDKTEVDAALDADVQNYRSPNRGETYMVDFTGLTVETDLSRLAASYLWTGKDPQSHIGMQQSERFFDSKPARKGARMPEVIKAMDKQEPSKLFELLDPRSTFSASSFLPSQPYNKMSSAISLNFPSDSPFSGKSTGIQSNQRSFAFGLTPMVVSQEVQRYQFLLERMLKRVNRGTPLDGNCLYHAVVQTQNGGVVDHTAAANLRALAVDWALSPANLPTVAQYAFDHGVTLDDLISTLSTNGDWSGDPGDLTPRIVASAIGTNIQIMLPGQNDEHTMHPLSGAANATITIELEDDHYSLPSVV